MKKLLLVIFITIQSQFMLAQIKTSEVAVENRGNTEISGDLSLIQGEMIVNTGNPKLRLLESDRANKNFSLEVAGGVFKIREVNDANQNWDRILINGNNDRVGINNSSPQFTLDVNGSIGLKTLTFHHTTPFIRLFEDDQTDKNWQIEGKDGRIRFLTMSDAPSNWSEKFTILHSGDVGIGTNSPAYKLQIGDNRSSKSANADQDADIFSSGGITLNGGKLLSLDDGYKVHANMQWQTSSQVEHAEGRFRLQGYYGFRFITRNTKESLMIKGSNGFVGIHNTNPQATLHVNGSARLSHNNPFFRFEELDNATHGKWEVSANSGRFRIYKTDSNWSNHVDKFTIKGSSGFVGINKTSPVAQLHVDGGSGIRLTDDSASPDAQMMIKPSINVSSLNPGGTTVGAQITNRLYGHLLLDIRANDDNDAFAIRTDANKDGSVDKIAMVVKPSGNVGIGVTNPEQKLHVNGTTKVSSGLYWGSTGAVLATDQGASIELRGNGIPFIDFSNDPSIDYDMRIILRGNDKMNIDGGNVGIGTNSPVEKLHVNGKIKTAANTWADFVFEETYELPKLEEVESHIDTHGHLKDIPAEAEILEEGYVLGDMDAKLLQKIEELTLYLIEQNKEIKDLKVRLEKAEEALAEK